MSKLIVKVSDFDVSNLSIGQVKLLESGGKACSISYSYGSTPGPIVTQLGPLNLPYGMNAYDKAGPIKYSMDLSLRGYEDDEKVRSIYQTIKALDEWMIDQGVKNCKQWFKADLTRDVVKAFYTPMIKVAKDKMGNPSNYPPTIKINLKKKTDGSFDVKTYDSERRPYTETPLSDLLVKGAKITTIVQCTSVWISGSKFGLSWKANQIRMEAVPESIRDYAFMDDGEEAPAPRHSNTSSTNAQNKFASLDEEEGEVEDDEAFQAPPSQPVSKKQSVLTAMMPSNPVPAPAPAPVATLDEEAEDHEPLPVPVKKTTTTATGVKKMVAKAPAKGK